MAVKDAVGEHDDPERAIRAFAVGERGHQVSDRFAAGSEDFLRSIERHTTDQQEFFFHRNTSECRVLGALSAHAGGVIPESLDSLLTD
ncbi:MAG TPA: hypothetical protein VMD76_06210 [Candidatus Sulfotelmatobacter sp.]|nr:hypothetical protein [Candidatus Sulfotelmatobacter sp.]